MIEVLGIFTSGQEALFKLSRKYFLKKELSTEPIDGKCMYCKEGMLMTGIRKSWDLSSGVLTWETILYSNLGEESGTIKNTALQLANYYESETVYRLKNLIEIIQVIIAMIIMVIMIALTLVSAETATVRPKTPGVNY